MSKESFIGGDYIETTDGSSKTFAKGYIENIGSQVIQDGKKNGVFYGTNEKAPTIQEDENFFYETDGHYSTVYLVCLLLGMNEIEAEELAIATEAPDTTVFSESDFELNDTWGYPQYQKSIHALTGGFHGVEEFITALKFLWLKFEFSVGDSPEKIHKKTIDKLGELLHRFGDTYAHTEIDNIKPSDLKSYDLHNKNNEENLKIAIESWKGKGGKSLKDEVEPWFIHINRNTEKYGYDFLIDEELQRKEFIGKTLSQIMHDTYLIAAEDNFIMYGGGFYTFEHLTVDGAYPDLIYVRPDWYLCYVKNLAWLISVRFKLNLEKFDITIFEKMVDYIKINKCSMKGIIDFEIAKMRGKRTFYIPVFYSSPARVAASLDDILFGEYITAAEDAKNRAVDYMLSTYNRILIGEVNSIKRLKFTFQTSDFIDYKLAYKISY